MTNTNTNTVSLHVATEAELDPRTVATRWEDPRTSRWLGASQKWRFEGGDAIVVCGHYPEAWAVVRVGDRIKVCDISRGGGVVGALGYFDLRAEVA